MTNGANDRPNTPSHGAAESAKTVVDADALFKGGQVLVIEFRGERYRLSKTRNGKLILTK